MSCPLSTWPTATTQSNEQEITMKSSVKMIRIIAAIAVGIVITVGTNGAFAKTIIRHDGNVVTPPSMTAMASRSIDCPAGLLAPRRKR